MLESSPSPAARSDVGPSSPAISAAEPPELPALPEPESADDLGRTAREYVAATRQRLRTWHDGGAAGVAVVESWTRAIDRLIEFLFDAATAGYRRRYVQLDQRCAVLAQGGYGRGELNPQ